MATRKGTAQLVQRTILNGPAAADVRTGLSEAQAVSIVLREIEYGALSGRRGCHEIDWLRSWCIDALQRSVNRAELGFRGLQEGAKVVA